MQSSNVYEFPRAHTKCIFAVQYALCTSGTCVLNENDFKKRESTMYMTLF